MRIFGLSVLSEVISSLFNEYFTLISLKFVEAKTLKGSEIILELLLSYMLSGGTFYDLPVFINRKIRKQPLNS